MKKIFAVVFISGFQLLISSFQLTAQNYFQQEVNYQINVTLDDKKNKLYANESIEYINNSPSTLNFIYFHLWPNAYRDRETALAKQKLQNGSTIMVFANDSDYGWIDSLNFKVNDAKVIIEYDSCYHDICKLILNKPLPPGERITITTPFRVKIPTAKFSRLGHLGDAFYITQWYPKPAVFDKYGWHQMPFLDQGEFYSEFGSYEVSITLPKNYVVGATGDLQNEEEKKWLDKKAEVTSKIVAFNPNNAFPQSDSITKTITYKQSRVHDFGWFADKRFNVLKGELELPHSKNKVTLWAMFTNKNASVWKKSLEYIHDATYYYSLWNGDYQYDVITAIDGTSAAGGGMEYPNITIINNSSDAFELEDVIMHEVGHNWFYGMLGSNERVHGFMDEGINSFNELRYIYTKYPGEKGIGKNSFAGMGFISKLLGFDLLNSKKAMDLEYLYKARNNSDQPIDLHSEYYTQVNYGAIMYTKTALVFDYLKSYLGDSLFDLCMQKYFVEWKFKHPYPDDLRFVFENTTGKNLSWLFDDLIKTTNKLDYKICDVKKHENEYSLTLKNKSNINGPVSITGFQNHQLVKTIWVEGFEDKNKITFPGIGIDKFVIGNDLQMPEVNRKNNMMHTKGILKKWEPLKIQFFSKQDDQRYSQLFYSPVVGWNNYDKTMLGIAVHNVTLVPKTFEYLIMPFYSTGTNTLVGKTGFSYNYYKLNGVDIQFSTYVTHYNSYRGSVTVEDKSVQKINVGFLKINPQLKFSLKNKDTRTTLHQFVKLNLNTIGINDDVVVNEHSYTQKYFFNSYSELKYVIDNSRTIDPYTLSASLQNGDQFMKASLEANYNFSFKRERKGVSVRLFAGSFIYNTTDENVNFRMSGWNGSQDYLFNSIYLGRTQTDDFFSHQFVEQDGGFKIYSAVGQTNKWLVSMNVKFKIPKLPVLFFVDGGTYYDAKNAFDGSQAFMYDGGICLSIIRDIAEIYVPLFYSSDIKQYYDVNDKNKFSEKIRFQLNINLLDPFELKKQLFN